MPGNDHNEPVATGILKTLRYFGIFRYPLSAEEIHRFHPVLCTPGEVKVSLEAMIHSGLIATTSEGFYSIGIHEDWTCNRQAGNKKALALLARSVKFSRIIGFFPFVDAVAISGSLSKYYAGEDADIDYFIITSKDRLWLSRSLLHLFKKLTFIPGYQHFFCMNYFIDTDALTISDQNIYTAIELATLIPVYNADRIGSMQKTNSWLSEYLPNNTMKQDMTYLSASGRERIKHLLEGLLNLLWADRVNLFLMNLTDRKWRKKWNRKGFPMEEYDMAFHTSPHVSKNHPANFQRRILEAIENNTAMPAIES